jgi:hypothetical protein
MKSYASARNDGRQSFSAAHDRRENFFMILVLSRGKKSGSSIFPRPTGDECAASAAR